MAENIDPFFVIDDSGSLQNLKVVTRGSGSDARVLPYSLAELVSSSVTIESFGDLTSSINDIKDVIETAHTSSYDFATASFSASLEFLTSSYSASQEFLTASFSASYDFATASFSASLEFATASFSASYDILTASYHTATASYNQLTASHDYITGSHEQLTQSNTNLVNISSSIKQTYNYLTSSLQTITNQLTQSGNYLKQLAAYGRATHVSSSVFSINDVSGGLDLAQTGLIPELAYNEQYLRACVDVLIQNNTNKNCYIKISHLPNANVSEADYTIVLPPGVIYNSEAQIASMRHVVYVTGAADPVSEVSAMMTYNSALRSDELLPDLIYPNTIKSLSVNAYQFYNSKIVLSEWMFQPQGTAPQPVYDKMVIIGQARVSNPGEEITLYIESGSTTFASTTVSTTYPSTFILETSSCPAGWYEFKAHGTTLGALGNGRVLFADLLITTGSI